MKSHSTLIASIAFAALLAGCGQNEASHGAPGAAQVDVVEVHPELVTLTREIAGRTTPHLVAEIRPQVTGIVKARLFEEGGKVKAGQLLYQIDDAIYQATYNSAVASLRRAQASLVLAKTNAERTASLLEVRAISQQEHDDAVAALRQAEADVGVAQASVDNAKIQLGYTKITSPIAGYAGKSTVTQGALVTANQDGVLTTVRQLDPIYVDVAQSSRERMEMNRELAAGSMTSADTLPVSIALEDGTAYPVKGKLDFSEASVDETTGSTLLRVTVANPDRVLLPGMYVRATIAMGEIPGALLVPQRAVLRNPDGSTTLMLVNAEGSVEARPVTLGQTIDSRWIVTSGLSDGDRVITDGLQYIGPGMPVTIASGNAGTASQSSK